jgi:transposase InsO family protein
MLIEEHAAQLGRACRVLGLPRSSYYYRAQSRQENDLKDAIQSVAGQFPTYGTRRIAHQLRRPPYRYPVGRKRIQRLMRSMSLLRPVKRVKIRTTNSQHGFPRFRNLMEGLVVSYPDHVWVADITYIRLKNSFIYLAVLMDVFTRSIRGWYLSRSLDQNLTLNALQPALAQHCPEIHHSDQGIHYAFKNYIQELQEHQVQISMAGVGKPEENGYAERLMRTIKEEEVELSEYNDLEDARQQIGQFLEEVYTAKRIHSALGYATPAEFEALWRASSLSTP